MEEIELLKRNIKEWLEARQIRHREFKIRESQQYNYRIEIEELDYIDDLVELLDIIKQEKYEPIKIAIWSLVRPSGKFSISIAI